MLLHLNTTMTSNSWRHRSNKNMLFSSQLKRFSSNSSSHVASLQTCFCRNRVTTLGVVDDVTLRTFMSATTQTEHWAWIVWALGRVVNVLDARLQIYGFCFSSPAKMSLCRGASKQFDAIFLANRIPANLFSATDITLVQVPSVTTMTAMSVEWRQPTLSPSQLTSNSQLQGQTLKRA